VLTHGFAVDEKGHKMSKSLGNVIAPQKVVNSLGADILRLWVAATDYRGEIGVSDEILKRMADSYRRMRNTARYIIGNLFDFDPDKDLLPADEMLGHDVWTVQQARKLQDDLIKAYRDYEFHLIYQRVHNFCVVDMGGYYLDLIKDRLYTTQKDSRARRSAQTALYHIGEAMVRWLAPVLSFTSEEIWQALPGERSNSVFLHTWYEFPPVSVSDGIDWCLIKQLRSEVDRELERLREADQIGSSLAAEVDLYCDDGLFEKLDALGDELRFVMICSTAHLKKLKDKPDTAVASQNIDSLWILAMSSDHTKCVRCWHRRADVGINKDYPELCERCVENVSGGGEQRLHT